MKDCPDCTPYETPIVKEGKDLGFTEEQIEWLCKHFAFAEEDYD